MVLCSLLIPQCRDFSGSHTNGPSPLIKNNFFSFAWGVHTEKVVRKE